MNACASTLEADLGQLGAARYSQPQRYSMGIVREDMSGLKIIESSSQQVRRDAQSPGRSRMRIGMVIENSIRSAAASNSGPGSLHAGCWPPATRACLCRSFSPDAVGVGIVPHLVPPTGSRVAFAAAVEREIRRHDSTSVQTTVTAGTATSFSRAADGVPGRPSSKICCFAAVCSRHQASGRPLVNAARRVSQTD